MNWKRRLKRIVPTKLLNNILLCFPILYRAPFVRYESNLVHGGGVHDVLDQLACTLNLDGEIVECGSSRCGTSILMAHLLRATGKTIYACDSFEGFDLDELRRDRRDGYTVAADDAFTSTSYDYVVKKLARLGMTDRIVPVRGYFQQTLPTLDVRFCFALIDCDLRESILFCANAIWSRLPSRGRMVFDDYNNPVHRGAQVGIDHFVAERKHEISEHGLLRRLYYVMKR